MTYATPIDVWSFAARVASQADAPQWFVLFTAPGQEPESVLAQTLHDMLGQDIAHFAATSASALIDALSACVGRVVVVNATGLPDEEWATLDLRRRALQRRAATVLLVPTSSAQPVVELAPNLWSWAGPSARSLTETPTLSNEERNERLQWLVATYGMTTDEVVLQATEGRLPRDPDFAEWLVLSGHSNLVRS